MCNGVHLDGFIGPCKYASFSMEVSDVSVFEGLYKAFAEKLNRVTCCDIYRHFIVSKDIYTQNFMFKAVYLDVRFKLLN